MSTDSERSSAGFERGAAVCAGAAAAVGLGYAVAFVIAVRTGSKAAALIDAIFLLLGGLLTVPVFAALYERLRAADPGLALVGLLFGVVGAVGAAIHGGYDLAIIANPPGRGPVETPNAVDPRGLLTFGFTAIALIIVATLIRRARSLPTSVVALAWANAVLFVVLYLGRLILLDPTHPLLQGAAVISGVVTNPVLYAVLAVGLWRAAGRPAPS